MKTIKYLLIIYAFFLIIIGPALKIGGYLFHRTLINNETYFLGVAIFLMAVMLFPDKNKQSSM
jgi:hypothetical protein